MKSKSIWILIGVLFAIGAIMMITDVAMQPKGTQEFTWLGWAGLVIGSSGILWFAGNVLWNGIQEFWYWVNSPKK